MVSDQKLVDLALSELIRRNFSFNFLLNVKIFHDPKFYTALHNAEKADIEYFFRKQGDGFIQISEDEHDVLSEKPMTDFIFSFAYKNNSALGLIVMQYAGNRLEGVRFDVEIANGEPRIVEESMDILCMLKAPRASQY